MLHAWGPQCHFGSLPAPTCLDNGSAPPRCDPRGISLKYFPIYNKQQYTTNSEYHRVYIHPRRIKELWRHTRTKVPGQIGLRYRRPARTHAIQKRPVSHHHVYLHNHDHSGSDNIPDDIISGIGQVGAGARTSCTEVLKNRVRVPACQTTSRMLNLAFEYIFPSVTVAFRMLRDSKLTWVLDHRQLQTVHVHFGENFEIWFIAVLCESTKWAWVQTSWWEHSNTTECAWTRPNTPKSRAIAVATHACSLLCH